MATVQKSLLGPNARTLAQSCNIFLSIFLLLSSLLLPRAMLQASHFIQLQLQPDMQHDRILAAQTSAEVSNGSAMRHRMAQGGYAANKILVFVCPRPRWVDESTELCNVNCEVKLWKQAKSAGHIAGLMVLVQPRVVLQAAAEVQLSLCCSFCSHYDRLHTADVIKLGQMLQGQCNMQVNLAALPRGGHCRHSRHKVADLGSMGM
jgi:hypothetical protein